jgi:hypothetical protein
MATARLIDSQKQELVRRFREGESTQALADHFGCSPTTVSRMVRAELSPEDYAALRDQRQKKTGRDRQIPLAIDTEPCAGAPDGSSHPPSPAFAADHSLQMNAEPPLSDQTDEDEVLAAQEDQEAPNAAGRTNAEAAFDSGPGAQGNDLQSQEVDSLEPESGGGAVLAIDDADDFADDGDSEDDLLTTDEDGQTDEEMDGSVDSQHFHPVAVLPFSVEDQSEIRPAPWSPEVLPSCAYLLVDKTVELQARPLADIPELGRLPSEEQERQALVLFTNPRQAKRHCGRTQRVIKLPDPALLGRTAPYLQAQGISRVVIEGALYALPEGQ